MDLGAVANHAAAASHSPHKSRESESAEGDGAPPLRVPKREGYLSWEDYFMAVAFLSAQRSKGEAAW